jgi:hypothetical protein
LWIPAITTFPSYYSFIKVDVSTINPEEEEEKAGEEKKKAEEELVMLGVNAGDTLYAEVRDQHVEKFGSFLQNQAMALRESHANFTSKGAKKDLTEIHQFVKQIPVRNSDFVHFFRLHIPTGPHGMEASRSKYSHFLFSPCCLVIGTGIYAKSS